MTLLYFYKCLFEAFIMQPKKDVLYGKDCVNPFES
jgi:hypothetical protein